MRHNHSDHSTMTMSPHNPDLPDIADNHGVSAGGHESHATEPKVHPIDHRAHNAQDIAPQHAHTGQDRAIAPAEHAGHHDMNHDMSDPEMAATMERDMRNRFLLSLLLTVPAVLYSPIGQNLFGLDLPTGPFSVNWVLFALTTPVVLWAGWIFIAGAASALRRRVLDMSVLIATGVLAAYVFSVAITIGDLGETFFEAAAMLVTFVLFGHWMEMKARRGTTDALRALFDLVPPTATVVRDGREIELPTAEIEVGELIRLRPGDKVPVDGMIEDGETSIDESLITGESLPVDKAVGDSVIGGSINRGGSVLFRAMKVGSETALAQIVRLVEEAQRSRAPGQRLADTAAQYLVILAVGAGVITYVAWEFFVGEPTLMALTFAISAVVIACPDALGLATPTAVAVGTGLGARHNILIKDAATLEGASRITAVVLDKTGTLTEGMPSLRQVVVLDGDESEILAVAAAAEANSEHPLARAIVEGAQERGLHVPASDSFRSITGKGIEAVVQQRTVLVGNSLLLEASGIETQSVAARAGELRRDGATVMYVSIDGRLAALIAVADPVKASAVETVRGLHALGLKVIMLTGDNATTAGAIAQRIGIDHVEADVLPADKERHVAALQAQGHVVAMVGDGVNDAPALARADIGIAIGAGTDVAVQTARVVLMRSDPADIQKAIRLSKATVRKMKQNLFWASIYNVLAIPVAAGVLYYPLGIELRPEWAALLMSFSSIIVAVNAVTLRRAKL